MFTIDDRALTLQFLGVLHNWLQEVKAEREKEIELLKLQEGIVKIMFARITRPEHFENEQVQKAGQDVFETDDWKTALMEEKENLLKNAPVGSTEEDAPLPDNVLDFFALTSKRDNNDE